VLCSTTPTRTLKDGKITRGLLLPSLPDPSLHLPKSRRKTRCSLHLWSGEVDISREWRQGRNGLSFAQTCGEPLAQLDQQSVFAVAYFHPGYLFTPPCLISTSCWGHEHAIGRSDSAVRYAAPKDGRIVLLYARGRRCVHATRLPYLSQITDDTAWTSVQDERLSLESSWPVGGSCN
jgi:hypothetical protein